MTGIPQDRFREDSDLFVILDHKNPGHD